MGDSDPDGDSFSNIELSIAVCDEHPSLPLLRLRESESVHSVKKVGVETEVPTDRGIDTDCSDGPDDEAVIFWSIQELRSERAQADAVRHNLPRPIRTSVGIERIVDDDLVCELKKERPESSN